MDFFDIFLKLAQRWGEGNVIRGEWWIDSHGESLYADQDVGDIGHEALAADAMLNKDELLEGLKEYYLKTESPEDAEEEIRKLESYDSDEYGASGIFFNINVPDEVGIMASGGNPEKWADIKKDIRLAYAKYDGAILVINSDFMLYDLTQDALNRIQRFIVEQIDQPEISNAIISIEDRNHKYNSVPINEFLQMKYPNQFWKYISGAI